MMEPLLPAAGGTRGGSGSGSTSGATGTAAWQPVQPVQLRSPSSGALGDQADGSEAARHVPFAHESEAALADKLAARHQQLMQSGGAGDMQLRSLAAASMRQPEAAVLYTGASQQR